MTVLSIPLKSSLNFLSNILKKHYKIWYSQGEKWCQNYNSQTQFERAVRDKIAYKTHLE